MNRIAIRFETQLAKLDSVFAEAVTLSNPVKKEILLSYIIIKLHDQWNFRSRQIILRSYGKSESRMSEHIRNNWSPRKVMDFGWEPDWHIPANAIRAGRLLNIPDLNQVQGAFGAVTRIDDIRWTRNSIVHNLPTSFTKYKVMTLNKYHLSNTSPYLLPLEINSTTGNTIYQDWCDELKFAIRCAL